MGRKVAILWHASFTVVAGVLFFYFVLPRWPELMGEIGSGAGTTLRIVTGALLGLAALPVVFTLLRTRKPELATPQLALTIRTCAIVAHILAGVLIIGTAISEHWFPLDTAGQWLFAIYGAAAAIGVLGFFAFYVSFVAELPPPPPKPIKPKKVSERRSRVKQRGKTVKAVDPDEDEADEDESDEDESDEDEASEAEAGGKGEADDVGDPADGADEDDDRADPGAETKDAPAEVSAEAAAEAAAETGEAPAPTPEETVDAPARLRNRRPTGKTSHRRRRTRSGVTVEE